MNDMASAFRPTPLALTVLALLHYEPLHPYGLRRLIRQWGKDAVINVEQRASLYRTIERLETAGLIRVRETGRDQQYPERTVYELTDAGRATARTWLGDMLATPKNEYPEFPAALSHLLLFTAEDIAQALETRAGVLADRLAARSNRGSPPRRRRVSPASQRWRTSTSGRCFGRSWTGCRRRPRR